MRQIALVFVVALALGVATPSAAQVPDALRSAVQADEVQQAEQIAAARRQGEAPSPFLRQTWAFMQLDLGEVLGTSPTRTDQDLRAAAEHTRAALTYFTLENFSWYWARAHEVRGIALGILGSRNSDANLLRESIAEFQVSIDAHTENSNWSIDRARSNQNVSRQNLARLGAQ